MDQSNVVQWIENVDVLLYFSENFSWPSKLIIISLHPLQSFTPCSSFLHISSMFHHRSFLVDICVLSTEYASCAFITHQPAWTKYLLYKRSPFCEPPVMISWFDVPIIHSVVNRFSGFLNNSDMYMYWYLHECCVLPAAYPLSLTRLIHIIPQTHFNITRT